MLQVGQQRVQNGGRLTRRELLRVGALSPLGLSLADFLRAKAAEKSARGPRGDAPARSVILLWLWGGPSHLDTFDMKPKAPVQYRGPFAPIPTSVPGIEVCELLPELARRARHYVLIRSLHCNSNDHGVAGTIGLTGSDAGAISLGGQKLPSRVLPAHGSVVSRVDGFSPGLPGFIALGGRLHQGKKPIAGEGGGTLGPLHDPFRLDYDVEAGVKFPDLQLIDGQSPSGLASRRGLLAEFDRLAQRIGPATARLDSFYQQAFALLTSPQARQVFDLEHESEALRLKYGKFRFGQCCLLARRLVESGARFVQVNWSSHVEPVEDTGDGGWDMHDRNFQQMQDRHCWMLDQALSALLDDLAERGMLQETVVVAVGEFGRTPKINDKAGRDHWEKCYSALVAGGGVRGGQVIGSSDKYADYPWTRAVTPADLFRTVLQQIGLGTTALTSAGITPRGEVIEEMI